MLDPLISDKFSKFSEAEQLEIESICRNIQGDIFECKLSIYS